MKTKFTNKTMRVLLIVISTVCLVACGLNGTQQPQAKEKTVSLEEKIDSKQQYIVITKDFVDNPNSNNEAANYTEEYSNFMYGHQYTLKQQSLTFNNYGRTKHVSLIFERINETTK